MIMLFKHTKKVFRMFISNLFSGEDTLHFENEFFESWLKKCTRTHSSNIWNSKGLYNVAVLPVLKV